MPSTKQLEVDNASLSKEVNDLKDERESIRTLLSKLGEEVKNKQTREEELEKEVESLTTAALEVFYEFWKAYPEGNFDYLGESKSVYLDFCVAQTAVENLEATTSTAPADQSNEIPAAQSVEPPAPSDQGNPYQEPGLLLFEYFSLFYVCLFGP
uniref:Uncharacterized protein n=1 Tax=Cannabis sativa TaxID=3483 RepID=A0A803NLQ7_CANSA